MLLELDELHSSYVLMMMPAVAVWSLMGFRKYSNIIRAQPELLCQSGILPNGPGKAFVGRLDVSLTISCSDMDVIQESLEPGIEPGKSISVEADGVPAIRERLPGAIESEVWDGRSGIPGLAVRVDSLVGREHGLAPCFDRTQQVPCWGRRPGSLSRFGESIKDLFE